MTDPVYILTFDQWSALTSAAAYLKGTGQGLLTDTYLSTVGQSCIDKAERSLDAVKGVRPTWLPASA